MEVRNLAEFEAEAARFVQALTPRAGGATLVTLSGELGAGKTAYVKAAAKALGVTDEVSSPTFVLLKSYALPRERAGAGFARLIHGDAYRLASGADLSPLRWSEISADSGNLVMLEWPERVRDALAPAQAAITLVPHPDGSRTITYA